MGNFLSKEELDVIQGMQGEFTNLKIQLADIDLQKHSLLKHIDMLRAQFQKHEKALIDKYGEDAVINMQTGEVTKK